MRTCTHGRDHAQVAQPECGAKPLIVHASGIWRREMSIEKYELHLESRWRADSGSNTGG
jgi:hypothetical protein